MLKDSRSVSLPLLKKAAEIPSKELFSRKWTSEPKRILHEHRERKWLEKKDKLCYLEFSETERLELRRYFDNLAGPSAKIDLARLENMLISLGVASTQKEVRNIVNSLDTNNTSSLDFDEYLEIFRTRTDSEIFKVFKSMMEGRLGDRNLNFQTVISNYRRKLFVDAMGARQPKLVHLPNDKVIPSERGTKILNNFATLQRAKYDEAASAAESGGPPLGKDMLPFDSSGGVPPGGLGMVWRGVINQYNLTPMRPASADRRSMTKPPSPRTVINDLVKIPTVKRKTGHYGSTPVIRAPALEEGSRHCA